MIKIIFEVLYKRVFRIQVNYVNLSTSCSSVRVLLVDACLLFDTPQFYRPAKWNIICTCSLCIICMPPIMDCITSLTNPCLDCSIRIETHVVE